ncbi:MAG: twin-arginine translocation signal domain-containing protein, partial [Egibacteraceae bacterium]
MTTTTTRPMPLVDDLTRRGFLTSLTAATLLGACGPTATGTDQAADRAWSFTDDRGVSVTLPTRPGRIAAF